MFDARWLNTMRPCVWSGSSIETSQKQTRPPRSMNNLIDWPGHGPGPSRWLGTRSANAVTTFAGSAPCAVIVDSARRLQVVTLSGKPDGMIVATAADRVYIKEVLFRPEPPPEFAHPFRQTAPNQGGVYLVMQRGDVAAIYNGVYFRSTNEVVADLEELIHAGFGGVWSDDYVIWCDGRIMAVIHQPLDGGQQKLFLFNEPRNDPIAGRVIDPMPFWPTYEEWVESGRGDLWKTDRYP